MIQSIESISSDDVCIPCRIRRSPTISNPTWDDFTPTICTLRQWNKKKEGPEVVLQVEELERWGSFSSSSNGRTSRSNSSGDKRKVFAELRPDRPKLPPIRIPCADILLVEGDDPLYVTLLTGEYMEWTFDSRNARDVVCAFLAASLPKERIDTSSTNHSLDACGTAESFDVEMLTANRMRERLQGESWGEKFRRKVIHVANRVTELSVTFSEKACAPCYEADSKSPSKQPFPDKELTGFTLPEGLEESPEKQPDLDKCHIPSGMSMEPSVVDV